MNTLVGKCQISNYILLMMSDLLKNKTIAVLGYGSQGRAFALNLRDSGYDIMIGLKPKSKSRGKAKRDGFKIITTVTQAVKKSDVVIFALPDHLHGKIFEQQIEKNLKAQSTLVFLHGLSSGFGGSGEIPEGPVGVGFLWNLPELFRPGQKDCL